MKVIVRGVAGVAGCCYGNLLHAAGFGVVEERVARARVPALMVSGKTQALMSDVLDRDDLFVGLPRIATRVVAWGRGAEPKHFPHSAVVVSESELLERLRPPIADLQGDDQPDWTIFASRPLPPSSVERRFGSRVAVVFPVELAKRAPSFTCWIESVSEGWLFLIPHSDRNASLLVVGGGGDSLLGESRLVAAQIQSVGEAAGQFPSYPAVADPFSGRRWLAGGSAALAFDPLCGDGTGNAIREAILATAVIRAVTCGAPEEQLHQHYRTRLLGGFLRHLEICRQFYGTGHDGPWWDAEVALIEEGIAFCKQELAKAPPFHYRLHGYELQRVESR